MQSRKDAIEQTGHITDIKTFAPVQTDPNQKMKLVGAVATMGTDAMGKLVGGNGKSRNPDTGTSMGNKD